MEKITIDGKEYALEDLSNEAKAMIANIKYVDQKIADLKSQIAVMNAAREYYSAVLKSHLPTNAEDDTVKFDNV